MHAGTTVFAALGGDWEPVLACGWLLSMNRRVTVTVGPLNRGPGAGPWAYGLMDWHVFKRDRDEGSLLRAAAVRVRDLAARFPGSGSIDLRRDQPAGTFDLLLVGRPPSHQSPIWNAEARRFKAVLVAPAETADRLGRNVTILADGPPRDLTAFNLARRLFPTMASLHLILDRPADPDRVDGWLRWLDCQCPVRVSAARRTTDARIAAILEAGGDLVVVERPARFWKSIGFEWRLPALIDRTPGAMLFTL